MEVSLGLWAAVINAGIFLFLIAIPWVSGPFRLLVMFLGLGGVLALLGFDFYIGVAEKDYDLAADLMLLDLTKAVFFFGASWAVEKVFRTFFNRAGEKAQGKEWEEEELPRNFDRNIRGLKNPNEKKKR